MNTQRILGLGLALVCTSGCSLVALSDDLQREQCKSNAECDSLNQDDRDADEYDPCNVWQCQKNSFCEKTPRDLDGDEYFAATVVEEGEDPVTCEVDKKKADCDDDAKNRHQGLDESCDDVDNDCDDIVDEGSLTVEPNDVVVFSAADGDAVSDAAFSVDPGNEVMAIAYSLAKGTGTPGLSLVPETLTLTASVNPLTAQIEDGDAPDSLVADSVGVAALQSGQTAIGMVNRSGRPRVIAGVVTDSTDPDELHVDAAVMNLGLRCEAAEDCFVNHQEPPPPAFLPIATTVGMVLASSSREVLVGYVRDVTGGSPECGSLIDAADSPYILVNALRLSSSQNSLTETGTAALRVDTTSTIDAPVLLTVPGGYLMGYIDGSGDVVVARLEIADGEPVLAQPQVVRIGGQGTQQSGVALALNGAIAADATEFVLAVAYQVGCAPDSTVRTRLYDISIDGGTFDAEPMGAPIALSDAANQSRPAVGYNEGEAKWAVVYRDPQGLRGRVIEVDGTLHAEDDEPYLLIETVTNGADQTRIGLTPTVTALGSSTWFGAVAYVSQPENADQPFAFRAAHMVCAND